MTKFRLTYNNQTIEFPTLEAATSYKIVNNIENEQIVEIQEQEYIQSVETLKFEKTRLFPWSNWKQNYSSRSVSFQMDETSELYKLWFYDGPEQHFCYIWKGSIVTGIYDNYSQEQNDLDLTEFETTYKINANRGIQQIDTDGATIVRLKAAKKGWTFSAQAIEIETSTIGGNLYCKDSLGNNISGINCKIFNTNNEEITTSEQLSTCVKTVVDFTPPFDYEVIGGTLRIFDSVDSDIRISIVAVPDIPYAYGGSREMTANLNLRYLSPGNVLQVDGRVSKFLQYHPTLHTNRLRFIFKHDAGITEKVMIVIETYKA